MKRIVLAASAVILVLACTHIGKIETLRRDGVSASISLPSETSAPVLDTIGEVFSDTLRIREEDGNELLIMRAIKDDDGEMVAHDQIKAAVVTARFRNVAERDGKVDIAFDVIIPADMTDSDWMLRFTPFLHTPEQIMELEAIQVTGARYRQRQLTGYERYRRFLESIITDTTKFIDMHQLEVFIKRNLPQVYKYKKDSSLVSESEFLSDFGVSQREAVMHYTYDFLVKRNQRRMAMKDKMRDRYIKMPLGREGLRLDTVISGYGKDIVYRYTQTLNVKKGMRKVSVVLSGEIFREDILLYNTPDSKPLDFYISSISTLADDSPHYLTKVVFRNAAVNTACYIDFAPGSSLVEPAREDNGHEISRIKANLRELAANELFEMDSILVTASCSPEGSYDFNGRLALNRAAAVKNYFQKYYRQVLDSLKASAGMVVNFAGEGIRADAVLKKDIRFITGGNPENWERLDLLVERDSLLTPAHKAFYFKASAVNDPDRREHSLMADRDLYNELRTRLYPQLRVVKFDFYLHRKGMIKDTVHTTELDTVYAKGISAIKEHDYKAAVGLLRQYKDYNSAVACCAAGYNASALEILEKLERTDKVCYMLALVYSRIGRRQEAVQNYIDSCRKNPSMISRGNLDPEISALIKEYNLQETLFNNI